MMACGIRLLACSLLCLSAGAIGVYLVVPEGAAGLKLVEFDLQTGANTTVCSLPSLNEVLIVTEVAHRAVTGVCFQVSGGLNFPLHFAAMTTAFMANER